MKKIILSIGSTASTLLPAICLVSAASNDDSNAKNKSQDPSDVFYYKNESKHRAFWTGANQETVKMHTYGLNRMEGKTSRTKKFSLQELLDEIKKVNIYYSPTKSFDKKALKRYLKKQKISYSKIDWEDEEMLKNTYVYITILNIENIKYDWQMDEESIKQFDKESVSAWSTETKNDFVYNQDFSLTVYRYKDVIFASKTSLEIIEEKVQNEEELQKMNKLFSNIKNGKLTEENNQLVDQISKNANVIDLKAEAALNENPVVRLRENEFFVNNSENRLGKKPKEQDLLNLFKFKGKGSIEETKFKNGKTSSIFYLVKDKLANGTTSKAILEFRDFDYKIEMKSEWQDKLEEIKNLRCDDINIEKENIKTLFNFKGTGTVDLDESKGSVEFQKRRNGYLTYIVKDTVSSWSYKKRVIKWRFFKNDISNIKLKDNSFLYGNKVTKENQFFKVENSIDKILLKANTNDIKDLFVFQGKGSVVIDESQGTYEQQMLKNRYVSYIVTDELDDGFKIERIFRFYRPDFKDIIKFKGSWESYLRKTNWYWSSNNNGDKTVNKPDINTLKKLIKFEGRGSINLDTSLGTYEEQIDFIGYATYFAVDLLEDGTKDTFVLIFSDKPIKRFELMTLKEGATLNGTLVQKVKEPFGESYVVKNEDKGFLNMVNPEDIKKLFNFKGKGSVKLDISERSLKAQYITNSFFYIITDTFEDGSYYTRHLIVT